MHSSSLHLPWLMPGQLLPPVSQAWGDESPAPGLLASGGDLSVKSLTRAYQQGVFPWFSDGQPILWWSPDPRMVLQTANFRLHRSLRKTLQKFCSAHHCEIRFDTVFDQVIGYCASAPRDRQGGTWIVSDMVRAYGQLHQAGLAHSVEVWVNQQLVGGLYCVVIGKAVFGESMFSRVTDASKIALSALVCFCRHHHIPLVDCQQNTQHLASLGAAEMPRVRFLAQVQQAANLAPVEWQFNPLYWNEILPTKTCPKLAQHDASQ